MFARGCSQVHTPATSHAIHTCLPSHTTPLPLTQLLPIRQHHVVPHLEVLVGCHSTSSRHPFAQNTDVAYAHASHSKQNTNTQQADVNIHTKHTHTLMHTTDDSEHNTSLKQQHSHSTLAVLIPQPPNRRCVFDFKKVAFSSGDAETALKTVYELNAACTHNSSRRGCVLGTTCRQIAQVLRTNSCTRQAQQLGPHIVEGGVTRTPLTNRQCSLQCAAPTGHSRRLG